MKIKWKRIKKFCEKEIKRNVTISLTTDDSITGYNSIVEFNDREVFIFLNALACKSVGMVIKAVAHEIAHVKLRGNDHSQTHENTWKDVEDRLKDYYGVR